jgi:hypothetical protein
LYHSHKDTDSIIKNVRLRRADCVQKKDQRSFCQKFETYIRTSRIIFEEVKRPIETFIKRQNDLHYGEEAKLYDNVPKILIKTLNKVFDLQRKFNIENIKLYKILGSFSPSWESAHEDLLTVLKVKLSE